MGTMFANDQKSLITNLPLSFECSYPQFFLSLVSAIFIENETFSEIFNPCVWVVLRNAKQSYP